MTTLSKDDIDAISEAIVLKLIKTLTKKGFDHNEFRKLVMKHAKTGTQEDRDAMTGYLQTHSIGGE